MNFTSFSISIVSHCHSTSYLPISLRCAKYNRKRVNLLIQFHFIFFPMISNQSASFLDGRKRKEDQEEKGRKKMLRVVNDGRC